MRTRGIRTGLFYLIFSAKYLQTCLLPFRGGWVGLLPSFRRGRGRLQEFLYFYLSLCKTDSYKGICGTCYSSTPKNDCFLNKVAYLCKQRTETPSPSTATRPTASPPTPLRMERGVNKKISPKMFRSQCSYAWRLAFLALKINVSKVKHNSKVQS